MAGKSTTLVIRILADASQAASTMRRASGNTGKFASAVNKATLPALAMVGALGLMGKAAADDAKSQALLANSLRRTAGATNAQIAATEDWITKTTLATGVADDQLRPALATLTRATGDVTASQKAMATVLDVSAATGKDTEAVANAIAKAYAGNTAALGRMLPGMDKAVLKGGDMTAIMAELARITGGSAAVAADTAAGKWQRAQTAFAETKESIGAGLLPVLTVAAGKLAAFGGWASRNTGTITALAVAVGVLAASVLAINAAMKVYAAVMAVVRVATVVWTGVQWLLNTALWASGIPEVVLAITLLVAAIVIAYKKSATFRSIVQGAFRAIVAAATAGKNAIIVAWNAVKTALTTVWNWIRSHVLDPAKAAFAKLSSVVGTVVAAIKVAWGGLKSALMTIWQWIRTHVIDPLTAAFNKVRDAVQGVIDWISRIKLPKAVQKAIDWVTGKAAAPAAAAPPPAPAVGRRAARGGRAAPAPAGDTRPSALASLGAEPQVIVQVSDRKMAQLVDVSIRASATSAARDLTRRRVVTV